VNRLARHTAIPNGILMSSADADIDARGNDIADAYLAAYALENNATWLSSDRGFARFRRLRWSHPLDV
jgi:uncharacterized protein